MRRFEFDGRLEERGGQQFASGRGAFNDAWTSIHRIEPHGFASMPVKGAKGLLLPMPENPDLAFLIGGENPGSRPADLPQGGTALYDSSGNIMKFIMGDGVTFDLAGPSFTIRKGGVSVVIDAEGLKVNGGGIWNDGVPVDKTHKHGGVATGGMFTSVPGGG